MSTGKRLIKLINLSTATVRRWRSHFNKKPSCG